MTDKPFKFGIIGADHNHIFANSAGMFDAGAALKSWWTREKPTSSPIAEGLLGASPHFGDDAFPMAPRVPDRRQVLEDPEIEAVLICSIPCDRAELSIEAMRHGKDVLCDKPAAITLDEMAAIRKAMDETGRIWTVNFSERNNVPAMIKAGHLAQQGAIGKVVQTIGLGPHRTNPDTRPGWFFDPKQSGGALGFMGSHQIDHFLFYTGSTTAEVVASSVGNFLYPEHPQFEDFGEILLRGNNGLGYTQVTWYTPNDHSRSGDNRILIIGTEGQIEVRKYIDVGGRPGTDHLFLMNDDRSERIDASDTKVVFFQDFITDVRQRTWTTQPREHSLLASELAIRASMRAKKLGTLV